VAGATIIRVDATILLSNRTSAASTRVEHLLLLSVNSTEPSCLAQRGLVGALPDGGDDGSTANRGQRQHDECKDAVLHRSSAAASAARLRVDCGQLDPGAVIRPDPGEWHPRMPERLDDEELADWRAGRSTIYQLAR
jgi:hypothetical protein